MKHYQKYLFGQLDGQDVEAYRLENDLGYQLSVMTYGATILEYVTPDKQDQFANIVLGFDNFDAYVGNSPKYGASIGPVAGRIAGANFSRLMIMSFRSTIKGFTLSIPTVSLFTLWIKKVRSFSISTKLCS